MERDFSQGHGCGFFLWTTCSSNQFSVPDSTDPKGEFPWKPKTLGNTDWKPLLWQESTTWKMAKQRTREGKWPPTVTPWNRGLGARAQTASFTIHTLCHYITSSCQILCDFLGHPWMKVNTMSKGGALFQAHLAFSISWNWLEFWLECWNHFYFQALVI